MYLQVLVFTKTRRFRKFVVIILTLLAWYIFVQSSVKSEWYVELYTKDNVTVKVPRDEYLEYKELWNVDNYSENQNKNHYRILYNESLYFTENYYKFRLKTQPCYVVNNQYTH